MLRYLAICAALLPALALGQSVPMGFIPVTGTKIVDTAGVPVSNATLCGQISSGTTGYSPLISGGGHTTKPPVCTQVTNGAFSINLPDTNLTKPQNACIILTVTDNVTGNALLDSGYSCIQPTSAAGSNWCSATSCNFDQYEPNLPSVATAQYGPVANVSIDSVTMLPFGATPTVTNSGTASAAHFHLSVPVGAPGTTTATGANGGFHVPGLLSTSALGATFYAGSDEFTSISSAVASHCGGTGGDTVIEPGTSATDTISGAASVGCVASTITDRRGKVASRFAFGTSVIGAASQYLEMDRINVLASPYNAVNDGITDNTAAVAAAVSRAQATHGCIYFPAGVYAFASAQTWRSSSTAPSLCMKGENVQNTYFIYNGVAPTVANGAQPTINAFTFMGPQAEYAWYDGDIEDITFVGGPNMLSDVAFNTMAHGYLKNINAYGAASIGITIYEGTGTQFTGLEVDGNGPNQPRFGSYTKPTNGLLITGTNNTNNTGGVYYTGPWAGDHLTIQNLIGYGVKLDYAGQGTLSNAQTSVTGQGLLMTPNTVNVHITSFLAEGETTPSHIDGTQNVIEGFLNSSDRFIGQDVPATGVTIAGVANKLSYSEIGNGPIVVQAGGRNIMLENNLLSSEALTGHVDSQNRADQYGIVDFGRGTCSRGSFQQNEGSQGAYPFDDCGTYAFDSSHFGTDTRRVIKVSYHFPGPTAAQATPVSWTRFTPQKSWRAIFRGTWNEQTLPVNSNALPYELEINETHSQVVDPDGAVISFYVDQLNGVLYAWSNATGEIFNGEIEFIPDVTNTTTTGASVRYLGDVSTAGAIGATTGNISGTLNAHDVSVINGITTTQIYATNYGINGYGPFISQNRDAALNSVTGPSSAPTGSCSTAGQWVFSQDGHATFCASGTWTTKI